jgi:signal transduction histidine kinase
MMSKYVTGKFLHPLLIVKRNIQLIAGRGNKTLEPIASRTTEIEELAQATVELSRALAEQDKLRKRLTSDVAHELRTPLATLQSHLEAMIDGIWEPTPERLSYCYDELIRLTRLISDLNELSVIENDRVQLNISDVNLTKLLNDMVENFQPLFSEKNITFTSYLQENIQVTGDKDRLKQIFVNILSNAFKYTQEQGSVNVELAAEKDRVIVTVRDTGVGIPGQDLPHIFERFYRGDLSRNRQSGGAGIGLTIAKALIEAHDGSLEIESEHTVGTIVKIALPSQVT